ncbi:MAG: DUF4174 domain-containing protein [Cyclobacteriaceae bacterium]
MKYITSLLIFAFVQLQGFSQELQPQDYQWHNRVLLVFAPTANHEAYQEQLTMLLADHSGLEERDVVVFRIFPTKAASPKGGRLSDREIKGLREKYQISEDEFWVILIGKDGSTKLSRSEPLANQELFNVIDAMPMRKQEMADQDHRED